MPKRTTRMRWQAKKGLCRILFLILSAENVLLSASAATALTIRKAFERIPYAEKWNTSATAFACTIHIIGQSAVETVDRPA